VVDDDPEIRALLVARLGGAGYEVTEAADGESALDAAREQRPDLIVLDVMMPGMSGWEVARAVRADEATASAKILVLTAIGAKMNELTSPLYGADGHLDKPFEFTELERMIAELLA